MTDVPVQGWPGWFETSKPCASCASPIYWHFQEGDRAKLEPAPNECVDCAPKAWLDR